MLVALVGSGCGESGKVRTTTVTEPAVDGGSAPLPPEHLTGAEARRFVRDHYRLVDRDSYDAAFSDFTSDVRSELGPKSKFIAGYTDTQSTAAHDLDAVLLSRDSARVSYRLGATAKDACGDIIDQAYAGTWIVKQRASGLVLDNPEIVQEPGETFVADASDCPPPDPGGGGGGPPPPPPPLPPPTDNKCDPGYSGCLDASSSDYDCAGGTGDGPDYISGPVQVYGSDPFGLDADGNGIACE